MKPMEDPKPINDSSFMTDLPRFCVASNLRRVPSIEAGLMVAGTR
jgi:hypothetical protein